jgi:hypothetical protein
VHTPGLLNLPEEYQINGIKVLHDLNELMAIHHGLPNPAKSLTYSRYLYCTYLGQGKQDLICFLVFNGEFYIFDGSKIEEVKGLVNDYLKTSEDLDFTTMESFWHRMHDNLEDAMKYAILPDSGA